MSVGAVFAMSAALLGGCTDRVPAETRDATVDRGPLRGLRPNGADGGTWVPGAFGDASTTLGSGLSLACCCWGDCPEGNAGCFLQYFESDCRSSNVCTVSPLTPTTDPTQIHPYWFLAQNTGSGWLFSGFSIPCYDVRAIGF